MFTALLWTISSLCLLLSPPPSFKILVTLPPTALGVLTHANVPQWAWNTEAVWYLASLAAWAPTRAPEPPEVIYQPESLGCSAVPIITNETRKKPFSVPPIKFAASGGGIITHLGRSFRRQPPLALCLPSADLIMLFSKVLNRLFQSFWNWKKI